jgi:hypothetical protein
MGGIYPRTVKLHVVSCLSFVAMSRRAVLRLRHSTCSLPRHISDKRNDDCIVESSIIHSPAAAAASASVWRLWAAAHAWQGGPGNDDMVIWMGKWQRKKKRAVCPDRRSQREGARAGWLHEGKLPFPTPLSSVSPAQCPEEWSCRSYHMAHISAIPGFNQVEMSVGG